MTTLIGEGLVKLVEIAVDGTKIRASASKQSLKTGAKLLEVEAAVAAPRPPCCVLDDAVASLPPDGESLSSRKGTTALLHETEIATLIRKRGEERVLKLSGQDAELVNRAHLPPIPRHKLY